MRDVIIQIKGQIEDDVSLEEIKDKISDSDICDITTIAVKEDGNDCWHYTKDKDFPKEKGRYLVWRDLYGMQYPEILSYDGRFWITGKDNADSVIVTWKKIEPPEDL